MLAWLQAAIDSFAIAVVLCEETGRVIFANEMAELLARSGVGIAFSTGAASRRRLTAIAPQDRRTLGTMIRNAATSGKEGGLQLTSTGSGPAALALITPVTAIEKNSPVRGALVTVGSHAALPASVEARLIAFFRLSPTQAALTVAIFNGQSLVEFAEQRQNKLSTVRSQLSRIFAKTGARTQVELMRLVAALPPVETTSSGATKSRGRVPVRG
jgi:DNA-binding CsgD family transcriptional regulator